MSKPNYVPVNLADAQVEVEYQGNNVLLHSPRALEAYPLSINEKLQYWADKTPNTTFLGERQADGDWRRRSYAQVAQEVDHISQALLDKGLNETTPIAILSHNSIDHSLLALAAMQVGIPVTAISTAYSLISQDHAKLQQIFEVLDPSLVYVADASLYAKALCSLSMKGRLLVTSANTKAFDGAIAFAELLQTPPTDAIYTACGKVGPDTIAKILFTSGSTGSPKGVINTQRMMCSNQQAISQVFPFLREQPPVILDWLPWSHTFGSNHNFNMALFNGGSLYIDDGKPVPGLIERTLRNIIDIKPTMFFNVPAGFDALLPHLEQDSALRDAFYSRLNVIFYAGAALPQHLWQRLQTQAIVSRGMKIPFVSGWGSTETAPLVASVHFITDRSDIIGLPIPGCTIKMVPCGSKMELCVKGPNITPGYWQAAELTKQAFDDEGFYRMGDAGRFFDPNTPSAGLSFDGRIAEDFKLMSGTWVHVSKVRMGAISAATPVIQDALVTGHNQETVGLLAFASLAGCRSLCPDAAEAPLEELTTRLEVRQAVVEGLKRYNQANPGSSMQITRVLLMAEPANVDAGEITDKGYLNQNAVRMRRESLVQHLYSAAPTDPEVIVIDS